MTSTLRIFIAAAVALAPPIASAQQAQRTQVREYVGETVMSAAGKLVPPWTERQMCTAKNEGCRTVIYRPDTRETAWLDGKWSTAFELTGNGKEVRRAEKTLAKAYRLKGLAASPQQQPRPPQKPPARQ